MKWLAVVLVGVLSSIGLAKGQAIPGTVDPIPNAEPGQPCPVAVYFHCAASAEPGQPCPAVAATDPYFHKPLKVYGIGSHGSVVCSGRKAHARWRIEEVEWASVHASLVGMRECARGEVSVFYGIPFTGPAKCGKYHRWVPDPTQRVAPQGDNLHGTAVTHVINDLQVW